MVDIGRRFRSIREDIFGMSQEEFAALLATNRQFVGRVERGEAEYRLSQLLAIERATGTTIHTLLQLSERQPPWLGQYLQHPPETRRKLDGFFSAALQLVD